ncbi:MAG TPA: hypothetical protein VG734_17835 [Lacunisphaera sp.]|nr:hypothetical protein [Lacunisphaera sp.]
MNADFAPAGRFAAAFRESYLQSLHDYRFFYDDLAEIGNPAEADHAFYFVPGMNGTPGQMRFMLPSLTRVFGHRVYLKALYLPEFSARRPVWEKYSLMNVDRKLARLEADLRGLLARFERVTVLCSSNGFYDFAAAAGELCSSVPPGRVQLLWGACAPDRFKPTIWERVFYPLNGFRHDGHRWFAYPNHNLLTAFNPETSTSFRWRDGASRRDFLKVDLESRFRCAGLDWCYVSPSQLGAAVAHVVNRIRGPLPVNAEALIAARDGYWQNRPAAEVERLVRSYLPGCSLAFQPVSHLWVVTPSYVTALFERHKARLARAHDRVPRHSFPATPAALVHSGALA